jgi:ribonuclease P protein component
VPGERVVLYVSRAEAGLRAAFIASRRVGGAVARNRARRVMRAAWRQLAPMVDEQMDFVFVARNTIQGAKTQDLEAEMRELLRRAGAVRA